MKKWRDVRPIIRKQKRYDDGILCKFETNGESHTIVLSKKNGLHVYFEISGEYIPSEDFTLKFADSVHKLIYAMNTADQAPETPGLFDENPENLRTTIY